MPRFAEATDSDYEDEDEDEDEEDGGSSGGSTSSTDSDYSHYYRANDQTYAHVGLLIRPHQKWVKRCHLTPFLGSF